MRLDHIRVGLVELGLLPRDPRGGKYRIDMDEFVSKSNICGIFGAAYPVERIKDPMQLAKKIVMLAMRLKLIGQQDTTCELRQRVREQMHAKPKTHRVGDQLSIRVREEA